MYVAPSVVTTFGTTDVTVPSRDMRRTMAADSVIAFVSTTIMVARVVSAPSTVVRSG